MDRTRYLRLCDIHLLLIAVYHDVGRAIDLLLWMTAACVKFPARARSSRAKIHSEREASQDQLLPTHRSDRDQQ